MGVMGPTIIEAPLDASSAADSAAASSVRLCAQPIQSPLTGGDQAAASEPGEPEPGEPESEYAQKSAANQSAGRGGQSKPQLSGGGCPRARRPNTAFCVACFPYRRASHTQLTAKGTMVLNAQRKGQRREPAAGGVRFVSERIGWLPFAAPPGSERVLASGNLPYICS